MTTEHKVLTANDYQELAMRTAKDMGSDEMNLIHAAMGMSSDAGEFVDAIKKHAIYGKQLDVDNAVEEIGDVLWFCALAAQTLGISLHTIMIENIKKLEKRYPEKYSDEAAIARADKESEPEETAQKVTVTWSPVYREFHIVDAKGKLLANFTEVNLVEDYCKVKGYIIAHTA